MIKLKQIATVALMGVVVMCATDAMAGSCTKQGSSNSIDWIKKKYKNCTNCGSQKDKKGKPTDNGWRTDPKTKVNDPHYDIVYEMFHSGVYIPFEESAPLPGEAPAGLVMEETDIEEETLNP